MPGLCRFFLFRFPYLGRAKRIWYLSPMRAAKVQASLRIRAVSPEPSLLAHTSSESRGTFRQKARSLAPLNGWACAVKVCHDGMLEDTNSLGPYLMYAQKAHPAALPGSSVGCAPAWYSDGCGFDPRVQPNNLLWRLVMNSFLGAFSPSCWFK